MSKYGNETKPIYLNVGKGIVDGKYHFYDITPKKRGTAHRLNDVGRVYNDLRPENSPSIDTTISQDKTDVNAYNTQNSEKDARYLTAVENGDTETAQAILRCTHTQIQAVKWTDFIHRIQTFRHNMCNIQLIKFVLLFQQKIW